VAIVYHTTTLFVNVTPVISAARNNCFLLGFYL